MATAKRKTIPEQNGHPLRAEKKVTLTLQQMRALAQQLENVPDAELRIEFADDPFLSLGQGPMCLPTSEGEQASRR